MSSNSCKVVGSIHESQNFGKYDEDYTEGDPLDDAGDIEIDVQDYLKAARRPVEVTRKNKLICFLAFAVLIISICSYVAILGSFHAQYPIMSDVYFKGPTNIIYVLMASDVIASGVGIWTCLKRTGPQPMIYACVWLLLSSLVNLCVTISLTFETKEFRGMKNKACERKFGGSPTSDQCIPYYNITVVLWCSLLFFILKIIIIILCRINYPQVFNWMMGKDVYVDEELLPRENYTNAVFSAGGLAAAFFQPPDLARIAARGSLKDASVIQNESSPAIFITSKGRAKSITSDDAPTENINKKQSRRSTFVSLG